MFGEHPGQADVMIAGITKRDGAMIERQQRRQGRELGVRGASLARLVGDVGEPKAVVRPLAQVRHHLLPADEEINGEILQRLHLDDDQVSPARGAEVGPPRAVGARSRTRPPLSRPAPSWRGRSQVART